MKSKQILKTLLLMALPFFLVNCKQSSEQKPVNKFTGRWIAQYFVDSLSLDNINTCPFGSTEINVPENDSIVTFWNEDVEGPDNLPSRSATDTLFLSFNDKIVEFLTLKGERMYCTIINHPEEQLPYSKADESLTHKADSLGITVIRLKINQLMAKRAFTDSTTSKTVRFEENGTLTGLSDFNKYYISIAGDDANVAGATSIHFSDSQGKHTQLGMKVSGKTIRFYSLKLLTDPDEKPEYSTDKLLYSLPF